MKYILVLLIVLVGGCKTQTDDTGKKINFGFTVAVVNGCQYVVYVDDTRGSTSMVHAGNCNNPQHSQYLLTDGSGKMADGFHLDTLPVGIKYTLPQAKHP